MGDGGRSDESGDATSAPGRRHLRLVQAPVGTPGRSPGGSPIDPPLASPDDLPDGASLGGGLFGVPGPVLATAVQAVADPDAGSWPDGVLPVGGSTDPWRQVIHAVVAGRRLSGWVLWAQLS